MDIIVESVDGITLIQPLFESINFGNVGEFKSRIKGHMKPHSRIVLDMQEVMFVDSSGIGAILSFSKAMAAAEGSLSLCSLTEPVQNLVKLVHLNRLLEIYPTREAATRSLATKP